MGSRGQSYRGGRIARSVAALAFALTLLGLHGCGETASNDCTTKATCPDDAAGAGETVALEVGVPDGGAGDGGSEGGCNGVCASPPPAGWMGPIALYAGPGGADGGPAPTPPTCPSPYSDDVVDGNAGLNAPAATCQCMCGPVTGASCAGAEPTWFVYPDATCSSAPCATETVDTSGCEVSSCSGQSFKAVPAPAVVVGASCTPIPGTILPPWSWQTVVRGCGYVGTANVAGCNQGAVCAPTPPSPLAGALCIYATGDEPCPLGPYTVKTTAYASAMEGRTCGPCTCSNPTAACGVDGMLTTYSTMMCTNGSVSLPVDGTCHADTMTSSVGGTLTSTGPTAGSCNATPGAPGGAVTTSGATTVCCTP